MAPVLSLSSRCVIGAVACLSTWLAPAVYAQSAENVAVVINDNSQDSQRIGEHYARTRSLPPANVLRIHASTSETIERAAFVSSIEGPIAAAIRRGALHDRVLYLVLTKGVPLRIAGTAGLDGTLSSVDSELTLLYRRMTGQTVPPAGRIDNPYFLGARELREAAPFSHREHDVYLVTRIDAFTVEQAMSLIDKAQNTSTEGQIVLDQLDEDGTRAGNQWLAQAARRLNEQGHGARVILEATAKPARDVSPVLGYYSWGAADPAHRQRTMGLGFVPGSIAANLAGSDARTFLPPPDNWIPAGSNNPATFFAGSSDSLIGDLVRGGVTGASGQVDEAYVLGGVRPEILFPAYLAGFNLAEAFYLATPTLSWKTIVVGDPLCRPFKGQTLTRADLEVESDSQTELPGLFAKRRLARAAVASPDAPQSAVVLAVRAEALLARGDRAGARTALEQALTMTPSATGLLMNLAQLEEADGLYEAAISRYQRLVELQPSNVIALNNLAHGLAVYRKAPAVGLPLAKRAAALAPRSASVIDTLAWIEHLLGNHAVAAQLLARATKLNPEGSEIRLHAAEVAAALGQRARAESELKEALRLNPGLAEREETRRLRERIEALPAQKP